MPHRVNHSLMPNKTLVPAEFLVNWISVQLVEVKSKQEFVPPNPNEFDKPDLMVISFEAVKGMKPPLNIGSGSERFSVKGAIP